MFLICLRPQDGKIRHHPLAAVDGDCIIGYNSSVKPTILAIIGKPLAGKDTQADLLVAAHPESVKISTGHIIRAVLEEGQTHRFWHILGPYAHLSEQGIKLPDTPVLETLSCAVSEQIAEGKKLLVIAGSPRSFEQLEGFEKIAKDMGAQLDIVHLDATDEETYQRSASRNEGRVDDTPQVHKVRLAEYEAYVSPVVEKLRKEGKITEIDGMRSVEQVSKQIEAVVCRNTDPEISLPFMARR